MTDYDNLIAELDRINFRLDRLEQRFGLEPFPGETVADWVDENDRPGCGCIVWHSCGRPRPEVFTA
jgi:hypothetical protein